METQDKNFIFAASAMKIIIFIIALVLVVLSRYAFIFFTVAMLPTIIALFFDRNHHKCASATICTFNFIGILPYLMTLISNINSINQLSKNMMYSLDTWFVIYGSYSAGQILYFALPLAIIKIKSINTEMNFATLRSKYNKLSAKWGIDIDEE
ncbi:MAG: hypothetical protein AB8B67_02435 [Rickettsiaceae bacterium]